MLNVNDELGRLLSTGERKGLVFSWEKAGKAYREDWGGETLKRGGDGGGKNRRSWGLFLSDEKGKGLLGVCSRGEGKERKSGADHGREGTGNWAWKVFQTG